MLKKRHLIPLLATTLSLTIAGCFTQNQPTTQPQKKQQQHTTQSTKNKSKKQTKNTTPQRKYRGDHKGEPQPNLFPHLKNPPAPVLSPQQALKTFKLQPGYKIQLVASEPLINDPVAIDIDEDGRIWAVEMNGYMRDVNGTGEHAPTGRVVVLTDTNNDGVMDKSTVFLDHLILPRTIMRYKQGVLVGSPPNLWYCPDINNDLKADKKIPVTTDYGQLSHNPEHSANGAFIGLDNWIYNAKYNYRLRQIKGKWVKQYDTKRGQWGICEDDYGRKFFNTNSNPLYTELVPYHYYARNLSAKGNTGINVNIGKNLKNVWPRRITLGVNRGYLKTTLNKQGKLINFTAACAPLIYRGNQFPKNAYGNAFVCEPTGYLIKRYLISGKDTHVNAQFAYTKKEFLTSTDERFRPVNLRNAPDGSMYVVDMYKGIFQHKQYLTTYLKKHMIKHRLTKNNNGFGRIYRIYHQDKPLNTKTPKLSKASNATLASYINHPSAWWRDTAKRLLIQRQAADVTHLLNKTARHHKNPINRICALWTLEGLGQLDNPVVLSAMNSKHTQLQIAGMRCAEQLLQDDFADEILPKYLALANAPSHALRVQAAFSLGQSTQDPAIEKLQKILLSQHNDPFLFDAAISSINGNELPILKAFLNNKKLKKSKNMITLIQTLTSNIIRKSQASSTQYIIQTITQNNTNQWKTAAILKGASQGVPRGIPNRVMLKQKPKKFLKGIKNKNKNIAKMTKKIAKVLNWPGRPNDPLPKGIRPLTQKELASFNRGQKIFISTCAGCHQPNGLGMTGTAPPLVESPWVSGKATPQRTIRIVLKGLTGPIRVHNTTWNLQMPNISTLTDQQIADTLTFLRRSWGSFKDPVTPNQVKKIRDLTRHRIEPWTAKELEKIK